MKYLDNEIMLELTDNHVTLFIVLYDIIVFIVTTVVL